jgi:AraC family transcriptional regulator, transcriptional activator of pobA
MEERIIRLPELITYHQINEVWEESIACFCTKSDMKNISKIPPVLADMFSFIVVEEGMAHYILNYKEYNVQKGDMLLFSPSMLVSLTGCTDDFRCMNLMCERSLFEHMLSSNPAFQTYSYYFCRTDTPVVQLKQEMQTADFLKAGKMVSIRTSGSSCSSPCLPQNGCVPSPARKVPFPSRL